MKIYALRHGKMPMNIQGVVNGEIDEPLAPEGAEQAQVIAKQLPKTITRMYISPLQRAVQTAEIISKHTAIPYVIEPALSEIRMGTLAGHSWEDMPDGENIEQLHRTVHYDYRPYGGESVDDVVKRLEAFTTSISGHYEDHEVLIITHGGVLRTLRWLETGEASPDVAKNLELLELDIT